MALEKVAHVDYTVDEEKNPKRDRIIKIRMKYPELVELKRDMKVLHQAKVSTTIKQLMEIARFVLHDDKTGKILRIALYNKKRNEVTGASPDDFL